MRYVPLVTLLLCGQLDASVLLEFRGEVTQNWLDDFPTISIGDEVVIEVDVDDGTGAWVTNYSALGFIDTHTLTSAGQTWIEIGNNELTGGPGDPPTDVLSLNFPAELDGILGHVTLSNYAIEPNWIDGETLADLPAYTEFDRYFAGFSVDTAAGDRLWFDVNSLAVSGAGPVGDPDPIIPEPPSALLWALGLLFFLGLITGKRRHGK